MRMRTDWAGPELEGPPLLSSSGELIVGAGKKKRLRFLWLCAAGSLVLSGCARTLVSENLAAFGKAASDISQQADIAFEQSNALARDVSIDRFVRSGAVGLSEDQFQMAISRESMGAWQEALTALSDYGTTLASLVDTKRGTQTSDAIIGLGQELQTGTIGAKINPSVATAFATLGGALVDARAQHQARRVIQRADPAVQQLVRSMADAIGDSDSEGLRGTVYTNWTASFDQVRRAYAQAAEAHQEDRQRELIQEYLSGLAKRDAQLKSLANLRSSLVSLGAAHAAAASGAPATVGGLIAQIDYRLDETRRIYASLKKNNGGNDNATN
jgi:hypothetical protein